MSAGKRSLVAMALLLMLAALIAFIRLSPWMAQDVCLDSGGAWHDGNCAH